MGDAGHPRQLNSPDVKKDVHYSDESDLNTLQMCLVTPDAVHDTSKLWLIYIHGGAWRDPAIDASSFDKLQDLLLKDQSIAHLTGLASINYRLSPYPSHLSDPSNPADPARNAKHPDHINDVLAALLYLQEKYHFEHRYILVGHSCGATLAMQVAMKRYWGEQYESTFATELNVVPPVAIVGVEGIYDIPALLGAYDHIPEYKDFIVNAFGNKSTTWEAVSLARGDLQESWQDGRLISLVHSMGDELLSVEQRNIMKRSLLRQHWSTDGDRRLIIRDVKDLKHDELWEKPEELAKILISTVHHIIERRLLT